MKMNNANAIPLEEMADTRNYEGSFYNPSAPSFVFFDDPFVREDYELREAAKAAQEKVAAESYWDEADVRPEYVDFSARMENRRYCAWLAQFYGKRDQSNDKLHRILSKFSVRMKPEDDDLAVSPLSQLKGILASKAKYAPGPIGGTKFVNPDGSVVETTGKSAQSGKASYAKLHKVAESQVDVTRVQHVGQKTSQWVIGLKPKGGDKPSRWYDASPAYEEFVNKDGEWEKRYMPQGCVLLEVPSHGVYEGHRLTVLEVERAILQGAELGFDDEFNDAATDCLDDREATIDNGFGKDKRALSSLTEEEQAFYWACVSAEFEEAAQLCLDVAPSLGEFHAMFQGRQEESEYILFMLQNQGETEEDSLKLVEFGVSLMGYDSLVIG